MSKRGFTLIELVIVIAIMGVLASVVLPMLNTARDKAADALVKSNLTSARSQAAVYFDDNFSSYTDVCVDPIISEMVETAKDTVNDAVNIGALGDGECIDSNTAWAIWVNLRSASTSAYCVDSAGAAKEVGVQDSGVSDLLVCP